MAALRQLTFEEPASRFARLIKTMAKHGFGGRSDLGAQWPNQQPNHTARTEQALLSCAALYGPSRRTFSGSEILALALALDDLRLFSATALTSWYSRYWASLSPPVLETLRFDAFREEVLTAISADFSESARAWLRASLWCSVDFSQLADGQPDDNNRLGPVLTFLAACDAKLDNIGDARSVACLVQTCSEDLIGFLRPELVLLVEGQTEAIVLPHIAKICGIISSKRAPAAMAVVASGGAQQVVRRYLTLKDSLRLPIVCVLDGDAAQSAEMIDDSLRACDYLVSLTVNELEDSYSYEQLLEMLNQYLDNHGQTLSQEAFSLPRSGARKDSLKKLLRDRGLGNLDKIEFAHIAVSSLSKPEQVPGELLRVMDTVKDALLASRGGVNEGR